MVDTLDILITSASRPDLLKQTVEFMQQKLKFSGKFRWLLHEDCLDKEESSKVEHWAKYSRLFNEVIVSNPNRGLGQAIHRMFPHIQSNIFFRSDDDWEYVREIDLDKLLRIFKQYIGINQILFHKRAIEGVKNNFIRESKLFNNTWLTLSNQWSWIPALWRTEFVKKNYHIEKGSSNIDFFNKLKDGIYRPTNWYRENMGSYFLGKIGSRGTYIKHIGGAHRTLDKNGFFGIY